MNELTNYNESVFENIKHIDENGIEYWEARELQKVLEYKEWRKFDGVINKAKQACDTSKFNVCEHSELPSIKSADFILTDQMAHFIKRGSTNGQREGECSVAGGKRQAKQLKEREIDDYGH